MDREFEKAWRNGSNNGPKANDAREFRQRVEQGLENSLLSLPPFEGTTEDIMIRMRDGHSENAARVYRPPVSTGKEPLVVWYHGGGYCLGHIRHDEELCRRLCLNLEAVVISLNYRLAPEYPFPIPINDCWDALQWVASNLQQLNVNVEAGFLLTGSSAGGNICAVLSLLARDSGNIPLTGVYLGLPIVIHPSAVPRNFIADYRSYEENKDAPVLCRADYEMLLNAYNPIPTSPLYSPLLWPSGHAGLPPTYLQVCGLDFLRDDGLIYERVLREGNNVKTRLDFYPGVPHAFQGAYPDLEVTKNFHHDMISGFRWLLNVSR